MESYDFNASATEREIMERKLYDASVSGNVQALDALTKADELILDRVSLTCFDETPLYIAAMRGHLGFTRALLSRKPKLASELDSLGRSPLHMACAEGHADVVRKLVRANDDACGVCDRDGMTPLHLAAVKGRVEVIRELLSQGRKVVELTQGGGESVLHLCVKYNRLEALKLVMEWMMSYDDDDDDVELHDSVNFKDRDGNTIFHLATALKQMETIEWLLRFSRVKETANAMNHKGLTGSDILEICPIRDSKFIDICDILWHAGVQRAKPTSLSSNSVDHHHHHSNPPPTQTKSKARLMISNFWKKFFKVDDKWLEDVRGNLILSSTVIASMPFQAILSPPGSVWQDYKKLNEVVNQEGISVFPGSSIAASYPPRPYTSFLVCNTVSLLASLFTILLTISGFRLKNKAAIWLLMSAKCVSVPFMALAYFVAMGLVCPYKAWQEIVLFFLVSLLIWISICAFVMITHTARFVGWFFAGLWKTGSGFLRKKRSLPSETQPVIQHENINPVIV